MKQRTLMGVSLAAMVALAGCIDPSNMTEAEKEVLRGRETISGAFGSGVDDFGNATRSNFASHIIDPAPAYAEDAPTHDGQVTIGGFGRYRTDKVKPPAPLGTF